MKKVDDASSLTFRRGAHVGARVARKGRDNASLSCCALDLRG
jgi:hypothetical protein